MLVLAGQSGAAWRVPQVTHGRTCRRATSCSCVARLQLQHEGEREQNHGKEAEQRVGSSKASNQPLTCRTTWLSVMEKEGVRSGALSACSRRGATFIWASGDIVVVRLCIAG